MVLEAEYSVTQISFRQSGSSIYSVKIISRMIGAKPGSSMLTRDESGSSIFSKNNLKQSGIFQVNNIKSTRMK